jgi:hypothetical protein
MDKHDQAKKLLQHAYSGDVTAFKKDYQTFQKERIVAQVQDVKQEIVSELQGKLELSATKN